jgi:hypothetical protein
MPLARADLESLLRTRRLDRTLTTALPPLDPAGIPDEFVCAPTGHTALDARLSGGFPRGQLSEIVGPRSSGRTSLLLQTLAAATARGELVALVDALDALDVASADAAGIDLDRLLWIRGHVVPNPGMCRDLNQRAMEQAIRAFTLVLQAGNFGVVAFDVGEAPADAVRRLPFTTWMRLQRLIEGRARRRRVDGAQRGGADAAAHARDSGVGIWDSFWPAALRGIRSRRACGSCTRASGAGGRGGCLAHARGVQCITRIPNPKPRILSTRVSIDHLRRAMTRRARRTLRLLRSPANSRRATSVIATIS